MSTQNDGGPAFPQSDLVLRNGKEIATPSNGMTLRDYFAAKALQGDWAAQDEHCGEFREEISDEILIKRCALYYRAADAMLKARAERRAE